MQNDPLVEWQRLTENYSKMYDAELLELFSDSANLTEQARQVLGDEMRKRGLDWPRAPGVRRASDPMLERVVERTAGAFGFDPDAAAVVQDALESDEEGDAPPEYTWKTQLCECDGREAAWQICEVLRRAGIESWVEGPGGSYSPFSQLDQSAPRILVAADRLEEARAVTAQPIPQEIVEQSQMQTPEFELPACPQCGAGDPVLEGVDPTNSWLCESCGHEWADAGSEEPAKGEK
jgi:hypothetical protein